MTAGFLATAVGAAPPASTADLSVTGPATVSTSLGTNFTYKLTVRNAGPGKATGVSLTLPATNAFTIASATSTQGNCTTTSGLDCNIGKLDPNQTVTVTLSLVPLKAGTRSLAFTVKTTTTDPASANNTATVEVKVAACTIWGTAGADVLTGTAGRDLFCALGGNDTIRGLGGNDLIKAGTGNDTVYAGTGADVVYGGLGMDRIYGGLGTDTLSGNTGADTFYARDGLADKLFGGTGIDRARHDGVKDTRRSIEIRF